MKLYYFPPSTYSQKVLIAFEEKHAKFDHEVVNLFDDETRNKYRELYPLGKIPLLQRADGWMIPESSIIIEFLDAEFTEGHQLIPTDVDSARQTRFMDRMNDLYLNDPIATLLFESWKPADQRDQDKIAAAEANISIIYQYMNKNLEGKDWLVNEFSMADCAAAAPLYYAQQVFPFENYKEIERYWRNLVARESVANVFEQARPYIDRLGQNAA
ncbi:MAG: glutathione S-transferase family protein [Pseudomonadota bacterium]